MAHVISPREGQSIQRRGSLFRKQRYDYQNGDNSYDNDGMSLLTRAQSGTVGVSFEEEEEDSDSDMLTQHASLLMPRPIWHDTWLAVRDGAWYVVLTTVVAAVICFFAVVHLTSHGSGTGAVETPRLPSRRIPTREEQVLMHEALVLGATTVQFGQHIIVLQGITIAKKEGHIRLPQQFYQGVHFGLSAWNHWGGKLSYKDNLARNKAMRVLLDGLDPRPSALYSTTFESGIEGFTVAYIAGTLGKDQARSVRNRSDPVWSGAEQAILALARRFQQLVVMKWHPKMWGPGHEKDADAHSSILQDVVPTRTGLRALASTIPVYRVSRPATAKVKASRPSARKRQD